MCNKDMFTRLRLIRIITCLMDPTGPQVTYVFSDGRAGPDAIGHIYSISILFWILLENNKVNPQLREK